jgi:O-acetylhomoserine (thiol)-lyase
VLGLRDFGPAISPFNAFMILTGIETLALRMQRHCDNALEVANWLPSTTRSPGFPMPASEHENHALQQRYSPKGGGAVFTFGVKGGYDSGVKFVEGLEMFSHLANIGDTRSLVIHPASTTHRQLTPEQQALPAPAPTWSACRSASRTSTTSSPISSRLSPRPDSSVSAQ